MKPAELCSRAEPSLPLVDGDGRWVLCALSIAAIDFAAIERASMLASAARLPLALLLFARDAQVELDSTAVRALADTHARILVVVGSPLSRIQEVCATIAPAVVVLSAQLLDGARARRLCVAVRVPVFVARARRGAALVAATDLSRVSAPVLRWTASLVRTDGVPVVVAHNIEWPLPPGSFEWMQIGREDIEARRRRLLSAVVARELPAARADVSEDFDTPDAILRCVQRSNADVLIVGAKRSFVGWASSTSVAARLVDECASSVLLVPFEHEPPRKG